VKKCEDCGEPEHEFWWDCEADIKPVNFYTMALGTAGKRRSHGIDAKAAGSWRKGLSSEEG
jgi:hypothetical protein